MFTGNNNLKNVNMCKAIQDIRLEGIEQGVEQGVERTIVMTIHILRSMGMTDE